MESKTLCINGMTCAACARRIERLVGKLEGVSGVSVNLATEKAAVSFDPQIIRAYTIREAIEKAGYTARDATETGEADEDAKRKQMEIQMMWVRFIIAAGFGLPLLYIAMAPMISLPFPAPLSPDSYPLRYALTQLLLVLPIICVGYRFYTVGFKALAHRAPNMDSLIAIGTSAALVYSVYSTFQIAGGNAHAVHSLYYESAGVIIALIMLGKTLETVSKGRTGEAVKKLMSLAPETAVIIIDGEEKEIPAGEVQKGDIVFVKPGAKIPADGTMTEGSSAIDESMLTGESIPVDKKPGDSVFAATINTTGAFRFRTEKIGSETALARIIKLVEEAQGSKAPIAKTADTVSGVFVPVVCVIAVLAGIAWFIGTRDIEFALTIFISVLVIACPCALGLATPTAIMVGTGKAAENGILIKSGEALETAHKIGIVVFDKTGTLTEGKPAVTDVYALDISENELLRITASAENSSEHPLGRAIVDAARKKGLAFLGISSFESLTGRGVKAVMDNGAAVLAGNRKLMEEHKIPLRELSGHANRLAEEGKTPMYVALDGVPAGVVAVADVVKPGGRQAVERLREMGVRSVMITGDNEKTARAVAEQTGIETVLAEILPEDKSNELKKLQEAGGKAAMVGDGINDAPALAKADIGIAIGSGTDVAIESADIVLMRSEPMDVVTAILLSKKTIANIKQNLFWAFAYNTVGIPVAAGFLYLFGGPLLNPMLAAAAMSLSSVSVITNALRLKSFHI